MVVGAAASLDELLGRASALQRQGRVEEAIAAYHTVLAAQPNLPDSWYNLAFLQRHARQFEAALDSYKQALGAGISRPEEVHLNRAVILSDYLARPDAAEADLAAALKINPHYVPAMLNLGNLHEDRGDREGARSAYEQALAVEPGSMLALARLAATANIRGKDDPVILRLTKALSRPAMAAS